ncbi:hypothetical protein LB518_01010 [Mesorhizobium sp. BR1-1-16]|uniref:hypothetical protein n=1 Tax=Mesorhizobium sp. BR1-1-16 TaxID=2876653 RepID=UPI001CCDB56C|nr:hypothetical protein [Mesorhizobium sp. BR1-1-16]MBZ9934859.1 hypothetical protein [Mesorhizobium sp. BR1-1-16]
MRGQNLAAPIGTAILAVLIAASAPAWAAAPVDAKPVQTQTITAPPDQGDDGDADGPPAGPTPDQPASAAPADDEPVPVVEYDFSKLPPAVQKLRNDILAAAKTGDINKLKPIIESGPHPPNLGADEGDSSDPITYLKSLSGDPDGREILAILSEVLEAGYVHVDVGTPNEVYLWPYFARYPLDKLTPEQMVQLFRLLTASDFDEMKNYGAYLFYRVGITPDGKWAEFQAGD